MILAWILITVLILLLLVGNPYTGWQAYGDWVSCLVGVSLVMVVLFLLFGRL